MKKIFFISDAHLGAGDHDEEQKKENKILSFFEYIRTSECRLFILGDFFDVWFEYKNAIPSHYFRILKGLAQLREAGIEIDFIVGNHDCWMATFFPQHLGIRIHQNPVDLVLQNKRIFMAHGHGLLRQKFRDKLLKKFLEHPVNIFLYRMISPDIGIPLARGFSRISRMLGDTKMNPEDAKGYYVEYAKDVFKAGFDAIILGHTHTGRILNMEGKIYLNLGDWITLFSYGQLEDGIFTLNYW